MRTLCLLFLFSAGTSALQISKTNSWVPKNSTAALAEKDAEGEAKPVFYLIVMGKLAFRHQISLWLSSLRKLGGYTDEVVLVTDRPDCLAKTLTEAELLGDKVQTSEHADIYAPGAGYVGNVHILKRPTVKHRYEMKMEKVRAWTNVKNAGLPHPVSSIVYTDEDIVIGKKLYGFMSLVRGLEKAHHTLAVFRDTGKSAGELHTGVVVMFPGPATDACMQTWGRRLVRNGKANIAAGKRDFKEDIKEEDLTEWATDAEAEAEKWATDAEAEAEGPDQQALAASKSCRAKGGGGDGIKILPAQYFWFPTSGGLHANRVSEFIHFTNTGRWKIISHTTIKDYLVNIGIPAQIDPMGHVADKSCV